MAWSPEISQLSTDVTQLANEVNAQKNLLSGAVTSAQSSRITANTGAAIAESSVVPSTTNMQSANTHKNSVLSIYGTQAIQRSSLNIASGQASTAATLAITASAGLTQDLSGITAQALHRSPNVVTAVSIYDTSKDSDGGAWTEKCQHTSWYNETMSSKWLGPQPSEFYARYEIGTLGPELNPDPGLDSATGWVTSAGISFAAGKLEFVGVANGGGASRNIVTLDVKKTYQITVVCDSNTAGGWSIFFGGYSGPITYGSGTYTWRVNPTGNTLINIGGATSGTTASFSSFSVREIISTNTTSNDYFQLATDGKFYRLWKNLLRWSGDFNNAAWEKTNITVSPTQFLAPDGTTTANLIYPITSGTSRYVNQPVGNGTIGINHAYTVYLKASGITKAYIYTMQGNALVYFDLDPNIAIASSVLSTPPVGTGGFVSASIRDAGNGWRACTVVSALTSGANRHCYTGPCDANASTTVTANGTNGILIWGAQLELGSVVTTYEAKVVEGPTSEVFRGNKRDFPRLAGIVAETASVTIYDLTEPGRPMWRRFRAFGSTDSNVLWYSTVPATSVSILNGELCIGLSTTTGNFGGMLRLQFPIDKVIKHYNGSRQSSSADNIATINDTIFIPNIIPIQAVPGSVAVNAIAMTVLPDAPTDPVSGLRVPTIYIGTGGGVSRISHNGTVSSTITASVVPITKIYTDTKYVYAAGDFISGSTEVCGFPLTLPLSGNSSWLSPSWGSLGGFAYNIQSGGQFNPIWPSTIDVTSLTGRVISHAKGISLLRPQPTVPSKYLSGNISNIYNTGWMPGDIRRVYLSDTEAGSMAGPDLVTNGNFLSGTTGWVHLSVAGATGSLSAVSGAIRVTINSGTNGYATQTITTVPGKTYKLVFDLVTTTKSTTRFLVGTTGGSPNLYAGQNFLAGVGKAATFIASTTTTFLTIGLDNVTAGDYIDFDNISVCEVITDRSYKAQSASITGIVTRSQAAAGTSLVGYSGFSTANYLQEPYSADLDFGTGEFSASAWVNIPVAMPNSSFPVISTTLISGDPALTGSATFSAGVLTVGGTIGSGGSWFLSGHTAGKIYRVTFDVLEVQASGNSINIRMGVAGNAGLYNIVSISSIGTKTAYFVATGGNTPQFTFLRSDTAVGQTRIGNVSAVEVGTTIIFDRSMSFGPRLRCGVIGTGVITAEAFDGTTVRTVTTTATYNTAQWLKAEVNYTTDGSLTIRVNGREVAVTRGNPLGSLTLGGKNLIAHSESFDNGVWSRLGANIIPNFAVAPNDTNSADLLYPASNGNNKWTYQSTNGLFTNIYSRSVYAKASGKNFLLIDPDGNGNFGAYFNLSTGETATVSAGYTAEIQPAGNDWYRCILRNNTNQAISFGGVYGVVDADNSRAVTVNGTAGILLWGAQIEVGVPTSYAATNATPLTIGNSFTANAPFPGSIALLKLGATVPTSEQSVFMYEQEKQLFRPGALSVLPDANAIIDMSYDDATDRWAAVSTTNESYWNGLVRSSVTAVPAGSYSKIATTSGVELVARTTTNPGVDVSIPPYALREEIVKRSEAAGKLVRKTVTYDYTGGFTGNITTGSTSIVSVAGLVYPTSYIGARISGTGIPANTVITGVSGTTIYISAPATATTTALVITFLDFNLPVGMEAKVVLTAGVIKREGSTSDYTRLLDGFIETIRFAVAPGSTAWVQIQATRTA